MASGGYNDAHPGTRWLYGMYVSPSQRGSGLANQLVDAVVSWARGEGAKEIFLHVTKSVARARAFYTKVASSRTVRPSSWTAIRRSFFARW